MSFHFDGCMRQTWSRRSLRMLRRLRAFIKQRKTAGIAADKLKSVQFGCNRTEFPDEFEKYYQMWNKGKYRYVEQQRICRRIIPLFIADIWGIRRYVITIVLKYRLFAAHHL